MAALFSSLNCKLSKLIIKMPGRDIDDSVFENSNLSLKYIEFLQTNSVTENGWLTLIKRTPSLETISLIGHFRSVTDTVIDGIFQYCNNIYDLNILSISMTFSKNIKYSIHLTFHLVVLSWVLIALIGLAPLEENMNPLVFWAQPKAEYEFGPIIC